MNPLLAEKPTLSSSVEEAPRTISQIILTAGPTISSREVAYGVDAVKNGWNDKWGEYLGKFEKTFAGYVGTSHAMATSSCTGAMHLALLAAGIGEGDEVIVPELTWIATASAVVYTGATPVFCDIDPESWTMLPESVERLITSRTKAIMPVHLYGHPCDMNPLLELARKHNLFLFEDSAQAIGAEYYGRKTGSIGNAASFSFQGAKAVVTGEGGMLVTSDAELMDRARIIGDHGRSKTKVLFNESIGFKYKMSNVQAAIGLAQIERAEEIVERRIQIFKWYQERLQDIPEISINGQKPWAKNIYWMSSIVLSDKVPLERDAFIAELKQRKVDSRPIFYPISAFPMFTQAANPTAYHVGLRGINLPSGHNRTEEEIDYICGHVRDILARTRGGGASIPVSGWLARREQTTATLRRIKSGEENPSLAFTYGAEGQKGRLVPVTQQDSSKPELVKLLSDWRRNAQEWFPSQFTVTEEGTQRWMDKALFEAPDRLLFFVENAKGEKIGHVGLFRFNYQQRFCELDNIVRGVAGTEKGIMQGACAALIDWAKQEFELSHMYLRVLGHNTSALRLYEALGFGEILRVPMRRVSEAGQSFYQEIVASEYEPAATYDVTMRYAF